MFQGTASISLFPRLLNIIKFRCETFKFKTIYPLKLLFAKLFLPPFSTPSFAGISDNLLEHSISVVLDGQDGGFYLVFNSICMYTSILAHALY